MMNDFSGVSLDRLLSNGKFILVDLELFRGESRHSLKNVEMTDNKGESLVEVKVD